MLPSLYRSFSTKSEALRYARDMRSSGLLASIFRTRQELFNARAGQPISRIKFQVRVAYPGNPAEDGMHAAEDR